MRISPTVSGQLTSRNLMKALWWARRPQWVLLSLMVVVVAYFCKLKENFSGNCMYHWYTQIPYFRIFIPTALWLIVNFWLWFVGPTTIYTVSCKKGFLFLFLVLGPKANFLQFVSAHVIVALSKNRLSDGLLEKFNGLCLLIFFYLEITPKNRWRK